MFSTTTNNDYNNSNNNSNNSWLLQPLGWAVYVISCFSILVQSQSRKSLPGRGCV